MNAIRPYILLILVASLFLSGCAGTQKVSKINQGDFTPALAKSVKAGEFFPLDFSFKNGDGPEITAIRVSIAEADAVKASNQPSAGGSVKAAGKSVVFDNIRIEKGATFQGSLLVRVDTPGAVPLGIVPAVKTDVWQSLEPHKLSVTVEDTERMKAKRARLEEAQNVQAEIKRDNINIEEVKSLASSSRAVLAGHEGRINTLLASKASLEQAKAAAPQSPEITETLALYDKELTWSRQQVESLKTIIDGYERELVSLTQTVETLTSKKKSLETEQ